MESGRSGRSVPRGLPLLLVLLFLAGCASTGAAPSPPAESVKSWGRDFLPEPLGGVTFSEDPAVFLAGWMGMIVGGIAGGWVVVHGIQENPDSGSGDATFYAIVGGAFVGAILGAIIFTLPVHGIEGLFRWIFG